MAAEHRITVRSEMRLYGTAWWRARCSCGKYLSKPCDSPGRAEKRGADHVEAKEGTTS